MFSTILAIIAISAAAGMRIALPLLIISLIHNQQYSSKVPLLNQFPPQVVLAILISWSLLELFASKQLLGQRLLQLLQLFLSPLVGLLLAMTIAQLGDFETLQIWLIGLSGGLLAFVLQLVQVGWFFRLQGIPAGIALTEDILAVVLVLYALNAPEQGGLIAMMLLWLALRSASHWKKWHQNHTNP